MAATARASLAALLAASGCYASHERPSGGGAGAETQAAAPTTDAGPTSVASPRAVDRTRSNDAGARDAPDAAGARPEDGGIAEPPRFVQVSASGGSTCALRDDGVVACWGLTCTASGDPPALDCWGRSCAAPARCRTFGRPAGELPGADVSAPPRARFERVYDFGVDECGIRRDGVVACWGYSAAAGRPWPGGTRAFAAIAELSPPFGACGVTRAGSLWCEGKRPAAPRVRYADVVGSDNYLCALRADGRIDCWTNACAAGTAVCERLAHPPEGRFVAISGGFAHACALREDGAVVCWGAGIERAPCGGDFFTANECGQSLAPEGRFTAVAAGTRTTCAARDDGALACWGAGTTADDCDFDADRLECGQALPPAGSFIALDVGLGHACAVRDDGTLACWGAGTTRGDCGKTPPSGPFLWNCGQSLPPAPSARP